MAVKQDVTAKRSTGECEMTSFEQRGKRPRNIISLAAVAMLIALVLGIAAPRAAAQADGVISGTISTVDGRPWPDLPMQSVSDQGAKLETKTDKDGNYTFRGLKSGIYHVYAVLPEPNKPYDVQCRVQGAAPTRVDLNFKDIIAKQGAAAQEAIKKQEEQKQANESVKAHFAAGSALLDQEHLAKGEIA